MSHDASGRTYTKRERKLFLVFLNYLEESSHDASGRTDTIKMKKNIFLFFLYL